MEHQNYGGQPGHHHHHHHRGSSIRGLGSGFEDMSLRGGASPPPQPISGQRVSGSVTPPLGSEFLGSSGPVVNNFCGVVIAGRPLLHEWTQVGDKLMLDVLHPSTVNELSFFMLPGAQLPQGMGVALYYSLPPYELWNILGAVHEGAPSGVFRTGWKGRFANQSITLRLGVSVEPIESIQNLEQVKGLETTYDRADWGRKLALDLYTYMGSFAQPMPGGGEAIVVSASVLDKWMKRFEARYGKDPNFVLKSS